MDQQTGLAVWTETVRAKLPHLSKPQAVVLALWSYGLVLSQSCGLTSVAAVIAGVIGHKENTVRQRLREWCWASEDKKGSQRAEVEVSQCFAGLLSWILSWWAGEEQRLALVLDATTLGERFVVLAISLVYRGCAIPVAWRVVAATEPGAWRGPWLKLLSQLKGTVPAGWTVIVLADRGLYARWLYRKVVKLGWHPFFRLKRGGTFRPEGQARFRPLTEAAPTVGSHWSGRVTCFKTQPLRCTLLACWQAPHQDPWLIITDLAPDQADALWYGLRPWIECGFKHTKRAGWQWQATRMTDPDRAGRLWLAIALATLWVVSVGGQAEADLPPSSFEALPPTHIARRSASARSQPRKLSCFRRGLFAIRIALLSGQPLPLGRFLPLPWPTSSPVETPA